MAEVTLGLCSLCGGRVVVEQYWAGTQPNKPRCTRCGAQGDAEEQYIIKMHRVKLAPSDFQI